MEIVALFVLGVLIAVVALVAFLGSLLTKDRFLRWASIGCACVAGLLMAPLPILIVVESLPRRPEPGSSAASYDLTAPQEIKGIVFPAGSRLTLTSNLRDGLLLRGELGAPATIASVPCQRYRFELSQRPGPGDAMVACFLARRFEVPGVPPGLDPNATSSPADVAGAFVATIGLADPPRIDGLACAPDRETTISHWMTECTLSDDLDVGGILRLRGGELVRISRREDGSDVYIRLGVLARPLDTFDTTLPAGTSILELPILTAEQLREGRLPPGRKASVFTPDGAVVPLKGSEVRGAMLIDFTGDAIAVSRQYGTGTLVVDGRRFQGGTFQHSKGTWGTWSEVSASN